VADEVSLLVRRSDARSLEYDFLYPEFISAPSEAGKEIGQVAVRVGERELYRFPVVLAEDVEEAGFLGRLISIFI
jgi:hypothetical protein